MKGIIYMYTAPNNKKYIGQTTNEERRKSEFFKGYDYAGKKINNAIRKFGPQNFDYTILYEYESDSLDEIINILNEKETFFIEKYDTVHNGYNISTGGQSLNGVMQNDEARLKMITSLKAYYKNHSNPFKGHKHSEETKHKLSLLKKGKPSPLKGKHFNLTPEQRLQRSEIAKIITKGPRNPFYGKHHTIETKNAIGIKNSKAVLQIDPITNTIINEFNSALDAGKYLGKPKANSEIIKVCRHYISPQGKHYNTALGFKWRYKNEGSTTIPDGSTSKQTEMEDSL